MRDETLIEPLGIQEVFCDGFTQHKTRNGNMSCVGFRYQETAGESVEPVKIAVIRLIFPKDCVPAAIAETQAALVALPVAVSPPSAPRKAH